MANQKIEIDKDYDYEEAYNRAEAFAEKQSLELHEEIN